MWCEYLWQGSNKKLRESVVSDVQVQKIVSNISRLLLLQHLILREAEDLFFEEIGWNWCVELMGEYAFHYPHEDWFSSVGV